jgi:opacity protein-like surface antigen
MNKLFILLIVLLNISTFAGDVARKGTTGADQLLIPVGARGIATGGAFLSTLTGLESIYYNPAGLNLTQGSEAMFSYMSYIADINISYFAASANLGELGSLALSFKTLDFGDIPITTTEFPDGTGSTYSPSFLVGALTYSKVITDRISVGTNLKLISETIGDANASGFAIDVGVQYRFNQQLSIGASLKNIGTNMAYSGSSLQQRSGIPGSDPGSPGGNYEIVAEEFQIPGFFELSAAYNYQFNEQNNVLLGSTFTANNSFEDQFNLGLEYGFMRTFFVRGGYNMLVGGTSDESIFGLTFGAGLNYSFTDGMGLAFDYAFRDVKDFPTPNHIFTVKLNIE